MWLGARARHRRGRGPALRGSLSAAHRYTGPKGLRALFLTLLITRQPQPWGRSRVSTERRRA